MKKIITLALCLFVTGGLQAQDFAGADAPADSLFTQLNTWIPSLAGNLAFSRASFDNWAGGGENSQGYRLSVDGSALRSNGTFRQIHNFQFANGRTKLGEQEARKTDDIIRYGFEGAYDTHPVYKPFFAINAISQLTEGFDYMVDELGENPISDFLSPAFLNEIVGVSWEPRNWVKARLGVGAKQTYVGDEAYRLRYGNGLDQTMRNEGGLDLLLLGERSLMENVIFKSEFNVWQKLFGDAESSPDVRWRNALGMIVNEYVQINLEHELFYDADQKLETNVGSGVFDKDLGLQQRQGLSIGIGLNIF